MNEDTRAIDARIDRDLEREGGYRDPVAREFSRRGTLRTLIEKREAAGVLQPRIPQRITTTHDVGNVPCKCSLCRKADPSREAEPEDAPKTVREMPLDGVTL